MGELALGMEHIPLTTDSLLALYTEFAPDLSAVRESLRKLYSRRGRSLEKAVPGLWRLYEPLRRLGLRQLGIPPLRPQFDDVCCEIVYLLVRKCRPGKIVEISPCGGWSTCWLLSAMRDNGAGALESFDIHDTAAKNVPRELSEGRWRLHIGDAKLTASDACRDVDYLFIDSDHSAEFAHWYIDHLLPTLRPGTLVSVDDVFHDEDPGQFCPEGRVIIDYLGSRKIDYFTVAPAVAHEASHRIASIRQQLGFAERPIHTSTHNPTIFFWWPGQRAC